MCGIVGYFTKGDLVAPQLYWSLMALQHRGKSGAGMALGREKMLCLKGKGELPQAFHSSPVDSIPGDVGIGQVRYGTAGNEDEENLQPIKRRFRGDDFYLVHNGNLINVSELSNSRTYNIGCSDSQVVADLISHAKASSFEEALLETLPKLRGAFNLLLLYGGKIYIAKDRHGFHPLQYCEYGNGLVVASESCALPHSSGKVSDVMPGEIVVFDDSGIRKYQWTYDVDLKFDIFEFIYFLRPDSIVHGVPAGGARRIMGRKLWRQLHFSNNLVCPIPDSGNEAALGYSQAATEMGNSVVYDPYALFRPHTVSRTFIEPIQSVRDQSVNLKFVARPECFTAKKVLAVDDSLVRGTTCKRISNMVKNAGAKEFHLALSSPPYMNPDFYGIDTYRKKNELAAKIHNGDTGKIAQQFGCDSVNYLELRAVKAAILEARGLDSPLTEYSFYCGPFDGIYPAGVGDYSLA